MRIVSMVSIIATICVAFLSLSSANAQPLPRPEFDKCNADINDSLQVLNEIMQIPMKSIPESMLNRAEGLVIIPNMVKGGFGVGGAFGRGVFLTRQPGGWSRPTFISMAKGSFGVQVGFSSTDIVLVFCSKRSIEQFAEGKLTLGVDAAVAAGPVGRQAEAGTDLTFTSEVYSYSRARGVFLGAAIDGGVLNMDNDLTRRYYGVPNAPLPPPAAALVKALNNYSGIPNRPFAQQQEPISGTPIYSGPSLEVLRPQLVAAYNNLNPLLDPQWKKFLALPPEFYTPPHSPLPPRSAVVKTLNNYRSVASNEKYQALASKPQFQTMFQLLLQWDKGSQELEDMARRAAPATPPTGRPPVATPPTGRPPVAPPQSAPY